MGMIDRLEVIVAAVRRELAADPRTSVFDLEIMEDQGAVVVVGVTSEPAAAEALEARLGALDWDRPIGVNIARLPLPEEPRPHAIVTSAVAPMQAGPFVFDTHVSQTLLGHRLLVLREHGRWVHCRSWDGYLGWVHRGYLMRVDEVTARRWESDVDGELCLSLGVKMLDDQGGAVVRLPWGARVLKVDEGRIRLPDGRSGPIEGTMLTEAERAERFPARGDAIAATALLWSGAPYVWGGVTRAGVDCSGLAQVVMRTHGIDLPRDSDQQAREGVAVDPGGDFANLEAGDLLFFAEDAGRVSHVAISMGGSRIVHASIGNGGVGTNDLSAEGGFERELRRLFVGARRMTGPGGA